MKEKIFISIAGVMVILIFLYIKLNSNIFSDKESVKAENVSNVQYAFWLPEDSETFDQNIKEFNLLNKNVQIEPIKIPRERYNDTINKMMVSGSGPDIFMANYEWANTYKNKGWMLKLNEHLDENFTNKLPVWFKRGTSINDYGKFFYCIPNTLVTYKFIYNKKIFELAGLTMNKPPTTIAELNEYCSVINNSKFENKKYGFILPIEEDWYSYIKSIDIVNYASDRNFYDNKNDSYNLSVYKEWYNTLIKINEYNNYDSIRFGFKSDTIINQFIQGNIGMMFISSIEAAKLNNVDKQKCDWEFSTIPTINKDAYGNNDMMVIPGPYIAINSSTTKKKESILVFKYLFSEDLLMKLSEERKIVPIFQGYCDILLKDGIAKNDYFSKFLSTAKDSIPSTTPLNTDIWARIKVYKDIMYGNKDVENELEVETQRINDINRAYHISIEGN